MTGLSQLISAKENVMLSVGLQLSVANGLSLGSGSEHYMVRSAGQVIAGGVESMIWIS
mgnify:CR=1 FL=1